MSTEQHHLIVIDEAMSDEDREEAGRRINHWLRDKKALKITCIAEEVEPELEVTRVEPRKLGVCVWFSGIDDHGFFFRDKNGGWGGQPREKEFEAAYQKFKESL